MSERATPRKLNPPARRGMSRGRLVLDESTVALEQPLTDLNILVLVPPAGMVERDIRLVLSGRILVTVDAEGFIAEATAYEYGVIEVPERMLADPTKMAKAISRAIVKHGLWAVGHSFVLNLGTGRLRDLWSEEQGQGRR